jgi:hypothetical protein
MRRGDHQGRSAEETRAEFMGDIGTQINPGHELISCAPQRSSFSELKYTSESLQIDLMMKNPMCRIRIMGSFQKYTTFVTEFGFERVIVSWSIEAVSVQRLSKGFGPFHYVSALLNAIYNINIIFFIGHSLCRRPTCRDT